MSSWLAKEYDQTPEGNRPREPGCKGQPVSDQTHPQAVQLRRFAFMSGNPLATGGCWPRPVGGSLPCFMSGSLGSDFTGPKPKASKLGCQTGLLRWVLGRWCLCWCLHAHCSGRVASAQLLCSCLSCGSTEFPAVQEQPASFVELALSAASVADTFGMTLLSSGLNFSAPSTQSGHLQCFFSQPSNCHIRAEDCR